MRRWLFALLSLLSATPAFAVDDPLASTIVPISGPNAGPALDRTVADLRAVFRRYSPGLDAYSKIVTPLKVSGTADQAVVTVSIKKCIALLCETVDLDGTATIREVSGGSCVRNYALQIDLSRSSSLLANQYDQLNVAGCYKTGANGAGTLALNATLHEASNYQAGIIQKELFGMLQLQVVPITTAIEATLKANGAN